MFSIGATADRKALPDPATYAECMETAFQELLAATGEGRLPCPPRPPRQSNSLYSPHKRNAGRRRKGAVTCETRWGGGLEPATNGL